MEFTMAKCANCANEAFYTYALTKDFGIDYCSRHVPRFLHSQKVSGMLPLRKEELIVEETVEVETAIEPEITPIKKPTTRKKKTVDVSD